MSGLLLRAALAACLLPLTNAFYFPGTTPTSYRTGDPLQLLVNPLSPLVSDDAPHSVLAFDYYLPPFHFCQPEGGPKPQPASLGSILFGDRLYNSPFELAMRRPERCKTLCKAAIPGEDAAFISERIQEHYAVNWLVDGLPAARAKLDAEEGSLFYSIGFELGNASAPAGPVVLYNHYDIVINYHQSDDEHSRVVGVLVWPSSADNAEAAALGDACSATNGPLHLHTDRDNQFYWTYSVQFRVGSTSLP